MLDHEQDEEVIESEDTSTEEEQIDNETTTTTEEETETETSTEEETETTEEKELPDYRQKDENKKQEMVPLAKHMAEKSKLKSEVSSLREELESLRGNSKTNINSDDLDALADEYDLEPTFVKKLASTMIGLTSKQLEAKIAPILAERQANEVNSAFDDDFNKNILSKYPDLADKKEEFKRFAFSPDFLHLKSLEDIRKSYFSGSAQAETKSKKETVESGSLGSTKTEQIDFANMNEETHLKVLKDPKARAQYFDWQEQQG